MLDAEVKYDSVRSGRRAANSATRSVIAHWSLALSNNIPPHPGNKSAIIRAVNRQTRAISISKFIRNTPHAASECAGAFESWRIYDVISRLIRMHRY